MSPSHGLLLSALAVTLSAGAHPQSGPRTGVYVSQAQTSMKCCHIGSFEWSDELDALLVPAFIGGHAYFSAAATVFSEQHGSQVPGEPLFRFIAHARARGERVLGVFDVLQ